jgi:hypothetical protein
VAKKADEETQGLEYQLFVLRRMIQQLPEDVSKLLESQLDEVQAAIRVRNLALFHFMLEQLDDIRLTVLNMDFDLNATKKEKAVLEQRLKDAGLL